MDLLTPELGLFVWTLVAFGILYFILKKFAWKPILGVLAEREKGIADSIATAERVQAEMAQLKSENEKLMQTAREERSAMLNEAKHMSDTIIAKAKEDTRAIADKMIADAQQQIQHQKMAAMTDVKNQIGALAVEVAEKVLRQKLGTEDAQNAYNELLSKDVTLN
ncbi:MAG: F0F1 ATP synthase subunit B [Bacteroidetes bacterium]|nr:F0F1 ATP synthase subunit B [Bacteroidota bacterium]